MLRFQLDNDTEIRLLMPYDVPALAHAVQSNLAHLQTFLPSFAHDGFNEVTAKGIVEHSLQQLASNQGMLLGIFSGNQLIGGVSCGFWDWTVRSGDIGYWLIKSAQGRGIATKAVRAITDFAFGTLGLNRLSMTMDVDNVRSIAIPERLGYRHESTRYQYVPRQKGMYDAHVYYLLAENWNGPQTQGYVHGMNLLHYPLTADTRLELLMPHHAPAMASFVRENYRAVRHVWSQASRNFDDSNALQTIQDDLSKLSSNTGLTFAMMDRNRFMGWIAYRHGVPLFRLSRIEYIVGRDFADDQVLIKAFDALSSYGVSRLNLNRIEFHVDGEDELGGYVAEQAGFEFEGVAHQTMVRADKLVDAEIYVKLAGA